MRWQASDDEGRLKASESDFLKRHSESWTARRAPEFSVVNIHALEIPAPRENDATGLANRILAVRYLFRVPAARRQVHLESGYEIQPQGRKAKCLLISLIQEVVEPPVDFNALGQVVGETRIH